MRLNTSIAGNAGRHSDLWFTTASVEIHGPFLWLLFSALCHFPAPPYSAGILHAVSTACPPCSVRVGERGRAGLALLSVSCQQPDTNALVEPGEGEVAARSHVKYCSSPHQLYFVFSEHPTLCQRCDKSLGTSEEGQGCRLKQDWPVWFKSSLIWWMKRCKSPFMIWGLEN